MKSVAVDIQVSRGRDQPQFLGGFCKRKFAHKADFEILPFSFNHHLTTAARSRQFLEDGKSKNDDDVLRNIVSVIPRVNGRIVM